MGINQFGAPLANDALIHFKDQNKRIIKFKENEMSVWGDLPCLYVEDVSLFLIILNVLNGSIRLTKPESQLLIRGTSMR